MPPLQHAAAESRVLEITECPLLEGKTCILCQEHIDLDPELVGANVQLIRAMKAVEAVKERRRLIRTHINRSHDQLTSRLPVEILAEIFKATLRRTRTRDTREHFIDSPLYLGAVCQTWRKIAWSTPSLWNWIHIFLRFPASKYFTELIDEWLKRSGSLPLTIEISCDEDVIDACVLDPDSYFPDDGSPFGTFIDVVNSYSAKWEYVSFQVPACFREYLNGSNDGSPKLRMLRVCSTRDDDCDLELLKLVRPASVAFEGFASCTWNDLNIAWNNVRNLYLKDIGVSHCINAIQQMPRLRRCVLVDIFDELRSQELVTDERFVHQNLQHFSFTALRRGFEKPSLFDCFTFPNLIRLRIHYEGLWDNVAGSTVPSLSCWQSSIKPFLIQSSSRLQDLDLELPYEYKSLVEALRLTASLRELTITDRTSQPGRFDFHSLLVDLAETRRSGSDTLDEDPASHRFLPKLQSCSFQGYIHEQRHNKHALDAILDAFGPVAELGNPSNRPLRGLEIRARGFSQFHISEENLRRFSELIDAGIDLQIMDSGQDVMRVHRER